MKAGHWDWGSYYASGTGGQMGPIMQIGLGGWEGSYYGSWTGEGKGPIIEWDKWQMGQGSGWGDGRRPIMQMGQG